MAEAARREPLGLVRGGEGAITGTVVCAAAIAYAGDRVESVAHLSAVILGTVAVYWIAHLHAITIGSALTHRHHPVAAFRARGEYGGHDDGCLAHVRSIDDWSEFACAP